MIRRILLAVFLILIGLGVWAFLSIAAIDQKETDVSTRFHDVISFYISLRPQYIEPLLNIPTMDRSVRAELQQLADHLRSMEKMSSADEQYESLLSLQRDMNSFFKNPALDGSMTSDRHFTEWNTEVGRLGKANPLLYQYNSALVIYNQARGSVVGRLMNFKVHWDHPEYLNIDGTTEVETHILF